MPAARYEEERCNDRSRATTTERRQRRSLRNLDQFGGLSDSCQHLSPAFTIYKGQEEQVGKAFPQIAGMAISLVYSRQSASKVGQLISESSFRPKQSSA